MTVPVLASLFYFVLFGGGYVPKFIYTATKVFTVAWPVVGYLILRQPIPRIDIHHRKHFCAVPAGVVLGIVMVAAMFGSMHTPFGETLIGHCGRISAKIRSVGLVHYYWAFGLFLSLVHSLIEEYYWRWFVFGRLRVVVGVSLAHVLAAVSFAAHHVVIATQFVPVGWAFVVGGFVAAAGMVWSMMYIRQNTLAGAWVCHAIADLGIITIGHKLVFGNYFG